MPSKVFEYFIVFFALLSGTINVEGRDQVDFETSVTYNKPRSPSSSIPTTQFQTTVEDLSNILYQPFNSYSRPNWNVRRPQRQFSGYGQNVPNNFLNPFSGNFLNFLGNPGNNNGMFNRRGTNFNPFSIYPSNQFGGVFNPFSFGRRRRPQQNIRNPINWLNINTQTNYPTQDMQQAPAIAQITKGTTALPADTAKAIPKEGTRFDDYGTGGDDIDIRSD